MTYYLENENLSLKAKGLLATMLYYELKQDFSINEVRKLCTDGETAFNGALKELQRFGYVTIKKIMPNKENGGKITYTYIIKGE